ncbi:hypothetical protein [Pseudomonas syringae]|uniref:hypothetical protein n=1 Tax=Pseudomonas syringae TaxID=317 RepID=UPI0018E635DA|nr:hypothetical protein [Pseudomonas syringae]MBI6719686.1 hypothetical protein [Pseudomonas syringae]MBI6754114.1 hypothetical protein [Pseudomonas syringae]
MQTVKKLLDTWHGETILCRAGMISTIASFSCSARLSVDYGKDISTPDEKNNQGLVGRADMAIQASL